MEGGLNTELLERLVKATERSAQAQEDLIALAKEESIETVEDVPKASLPICPHCGTFNPVIRNEGAGGELTEFVLVAWCTNCSNQFIAMPMGWQIFADKQAFEGREQK